MNSLPSLTALSFQGNAALNFKDFEQNFTMYLEASGMSEKPAKQKAALLLHVMGQEAVRVFNCFTWAPAKGVVGKDGYVAAENKDDYKTTLRKLQAHCRPKTNVTYDRYLFNRRQQGEGESFDKYYSDLCNLAQPCEFGELAEQMVQDRIVLAFHPTRCVVGYFVMVTSLYKKP